jgi:hypothetical protein
VPTQLDILDAFNEEMQSFLSDIETSSSSSLSLELSPSISDHVGLRQRYQRSVHPFIAFERNGTPSPLNRGLGDNRTVVQKLVDGGNKVRAYVYRKAYEMELTITVITDGNDTRTVLKLGELLRDRIENYGGGGTKSLSEIEPGIRNVSLVRTFDSSRVTENIIGQSMVYRIRYDKFSTESVDTIEEIDITVVEADTETEYYPDTGDDAVPAVEIDTTEIS